MLNGKFILHVSRPHFSKRKQLLYGKKLCNDIIFWNHPNIRKQKVKRQKDSYANKQHAYAPQHSILKCMYNIVYCNIGTV